MLVHPNPMRRVGHDWVDSHTNRVEVKYQRINRGNHRDRWKVYARRRKGAPLMLSSTHITEEQAVVCAQTLANRIYRLSQKKKKKPTPPVVLSISRETANTIQKLVSDALQGGQCPSEGSIHANAIASAREAVILLEREFKLRKRS